MKIDKDDNQLMNNDEQQQGMTKNQKTNSTSICCTSCEKFLQFHVFGVSCIWCCGNIRNKQ